MSAGTIAEPEPREHRALSLAAAVGLFAPAAITWSGITHSVAVGIVGAALAAAALLLVAATAAAPTDARLRRLDTLLLAVGLLALIATAWAHVAPQPFHPTDGAALTRGAAVTLSRGQDPYGANLAWSLRSYGVRSPTRLISGGLVDTLGTPPLPVLLTLPLVALGIHGAVVTVVAVTTLALATIVIFVLLPASRRPLAVLVGVDVGILPLLAASGASAVMMLAALSVCAVRWRRVGTPAGGLGRGGALRALALGLALSANQIAWFVAPFLLIATYLAARERLGGARARRVVAHYALLAAAVFLVIDAPFLIWAPHAWWLGVTAPLREVLFPSGRGLVALATLGRMGGGALDFYAYGSLLLYLGLLALFTLRFDRLSRCVFLLPLAVLYTSDRALATDWVGMAAPVIVGAICDGRGVGEAADASAAFARAGGRWLVLVLVPALACFLVALGTPGPLTLELVASHDQRGGHSPVQLAVFVRNDSAQALTPRFAVNTTGPLTLFWRRLRGPAVLDPGTSARYVLAAPSRSASPHPGSTYIVQALTLAPRTISSSAVISLPRLPEASA